MKILSNRDFRKSIKRTVFSSVKDLLSMYLYNTGAIQLNVHYGYNRAKNQVDILIVQK